MANSAGNVVDPLEAAPDSTTRALHASTGLGATGRVRRSPADGSLPIGARASRTSSRRDQLPPLAEDAGRHVHLNSHRPRPKARKRSVLPDFADLGWDVVAVSMWASRGVKIFGPRDRIRIAPKLHNAVSRSEHGRFLGFPSHFVNLEQCVSSQNGAPTPGQSQFADFLTETDASILARSMQ